LPIQDSPFKTIEFVPGQPQSLPYGIGTWAWGDGLYWSLGSSKIDRADLFKAFQYCLDSGVTLFDTAEVYSTGRSEKLLGRFIAESDRQIRIATKFFPYPWRRSKSFRRALKKSLIRLGVESIALYQMHWPRPGVPIETWMNLMADAVDDGLIEAVGVSNYNLEQTQRAYDALNKRGIKLASNQIIYNLIQRGNEFNGLIGLCRDLDVKIISYSPLAQGILTGKFGPDKRPPFIRGFRHNSLEKYQPLIESLRAIAKTHQSTPAGVALNWTLCKGTIPIPGIKSLTQAKDNLAALTWRLTDSELDQLEKLSTSVR
jgi:aryl-alcohol dehydrogenase-like predicted oxidoreductase